MGCSPAPSCRAALHEADLMFPRRSKASDGICASPKHSQQNPNSDHERGEAWDLTHDPAHGCDVDALFRQIVDRRDPRVKYLIRNNRILRSYAKPGIPAWTWGPYSGSNPHTKHGHCSILPNARHDVSRWFNTVAPTPPPISKPAPQEDDDAMKIITPQVPRGHPDHGSQWLQRGKQLLLLRGEPVDEAQQARNAGAPEGHMENPLWDSLKKASEVVLP